MSIPEKALEIKFIHASGPGGQNVNKVATKVEMRFDPEEAGLSPLARLRLKLLAGKRMTREGLIIIQVQTHRSQAKNKEEAYGILERLLKAASAPPPRPRKATRPTFQSVERRLAAKKIRSRLKSARNFQED